MHTREAPTEAASAAAAKAAPALTVTGMTLFGYPVADWVAIATLIYVIIQIVLLLRKFNHRQRRTDSRLPPNSGQIRPKMAASLLALSAAGVALIASFEGTQTEAYLDPVGIPTICTGHTNNVFLGQQRTLKECEALLREDTSYAGQAIRQCTTVDLTQAQYDVLVSFVFNVGGNAYCKSTLARKLNADDCWGAASEFDRWIYAKKPKAKKPKAKKLPGLVKRRAAERKLFETGCLV